MHQHSHVHAAWGMTALALGALLSGIAYVYLASRQRRAAKGWSGWRTAGFVSGCLMLTLGLSPGALPYPSGDFRGHMLQHLLIGMVAPVALVLAAPMTLLLRSLPAHHGRRIGRALRSRFVHFFANPVTALVLNLGGMGALYFTPLYALANESAVVHLAIHVHFLAAGCLFAWVIAGPDPAPARPSVPARLVVLGVAIAVHAILSQLLYAGLFVTVPVPPLQRRGGAELMYYGGDMAELLLAFALVSSWRPRRRAALGVR